MPTALASLRAYPGRFIAVILAIVIGVGFAVATLVFTATFTTELTRSVGAAATGVDVIAEPSRSGDAAAAFDRTLFSNILGVASAEPVYRGYARFSAERARGGLDIDTVTVNPALRWVTVGTGTWPTGDSQIGVEQDTATRNGLSLGSVLTLTTPAGIDHSVTVVALIDTGSSRLAGLSGAGDRAWAAPGLAAALAEGQLSQIDLLASPGVDADTLAANARIALGAGFDVRTGTEVAKGQVAQAVGSAKTLPMILLTFAAIAGLVASFVIANTFTILLAQRQRQLALMRCIGAGVGQLRRSILTEATAIGVIGSLTGAALGILVGRATLGIADLHADNFTVQPVGITMAVLIGVLVTVLVALAPSARATRVSPLAALSPVPTAAQARRAGRIRTVLGVLLLLGGGAGLAAGVILPALLVAVAGGAVSAVGVLLLLRSTLPPVLRVLGRTGGLAGIPGRLAAANAIRNPGRAAATSSALVVAVGLIVMLQVAAASARTSLNAALSAHFPLDISVTVAPESWVAGQIGQLPVGLVDGLAGVDGLSAIALAGSTTTLTLGNDSGATMMVLLGVPDPIGPIIRSAPLEPGTVAVPDWMFRADNLTVGDQLTFTRNAGSVTLRVVESRLANGPGMTAVTTAADLAALDPAAGPAAIWGRVAEMDHANEIIARINPLLAAYPSLELTGNAPDHAAIDDSLSTMLLVATALLAVAALIAVVGIGNTLGLSVVERTRESALLRALGLRRGQLRLMLGVEAALLAGVGALVGIGIGVGYGWIGTASAFGELGVPPVLDLPVAKLTLVLGLALAAGVLASVLPARRAAMAAPTDALAEV